MDEVTSMVLGDNTIVFEGKKRYYVEDLTKRDFTLENTTPHLLKIDDYDFAENTWVEMIRNLTAYLILKYPNKKSEIPDFKTEWSKSNIFSATPRTNFKQLSENLYVNCNHTALHSCWLIQDLLDFFGVDKSKVYFLVHRTPHAEPNEARKYFISKFKEEFALYLAMNQNKSNESITNIISNIEKYMDPIQAKLSRSYDSLMLFEDILSFTNYSIKFLEYIDSNPKMNEKTKLTMKRYIGYLKDFYKL